MIEQAGGNTQHAGAAASVHRSDNDGTAAATCAQVFSVDCNPAQSALLELKAVGWLGRAGLSGLQRSRARQIHRTAGWTESGDRRLRRAAAAAMGIAWRGARHTLLSDSSPCIWLLPSSAGGHPAAGV